MVEQSTTPISTSIQTNNPHLKYLLSYVPHPSLILCNLHPFLHSSCPSQFPTLQASRRKKINPSHSPQEPAAYLRVPIHPLISHQSFKIPQSPPSEEIPLNSLGPNYPFTHLLEPSFQTLQLTLLNNQRLIIEIFNNIIMFILVDFENYRFNRWITFYEDAYKSEGGDRRGYLVIRFNIYSIFLK